MDQDPLAHLCPLCGQSNACQQVELSKNSDNASVEKACWCMAEKLTEQSRHRLNAQTDGKRCL